MKDLTALAFFIGFLLGLALMGGLALSFNYSYNKKALEVGAAEYYHASPSSSSVEFRYITNYQVLSARTNK